MDAAARTRELERSLYGAGWSFGLFVFTLQLPVMPVLAGGYLAYELRGCAAASSREVARPLRSAAWLLLPAPVCSTVAFFTDTRWVAAGLPFLAAALYCAVAGFALMAEWFGGQARWQRARHETTAAAGALCLLAGLVVSRSGEAAERITFGAGDHAAVQIAVIAAGVATLYGLWRLSLAFRDLRLRVCAAIDADELAGTLATRG